VPGNGAGAPVNPSGTSAGDPAELACIVPGRRRLGAQKKRAVFRNSDHQQRFTMTEYHRQPTIAGIGRSISHYVL